MCQSALCQLFTLDAPTSGKKSGKKGKKRQPFTGKEESFTYFSSEMISLNGPFRQLTRQATPKLRCVNQLQLGRQFTMGYLLLADSKWTLLKERTTVHSGEMLCLLIFLVKSPRLFFTLASIGAPVLLFSFPVLLFARRPSQISPKTLSPLSATLSNKGHEEVPKRETCVT